MKESKKYYTRRNLITNKDQKDSNQENSKYNNNYQNSLITEILENNKDLKMINDNGNSYNANNAKSNIQNIFSTDESRLKAIKYIMKSSQEKRDLNPNYSSSNKELFPQEKEKRESSLDNGLYRTNYILENYNKDRIPKKGNYYKRHILPISFEKNLLIDEELKNHSHNNSKDNYRERSKKYKKRIIVKKDNNDNNNIKFYKFPVQNKTNKNYNFTINLNNINDKNAKEKEDKKEKSGKIIPEIKDNQNDKKEEEKNCLNISFSEDGPFMLKNENNEKKENINDRNNIKDNNDEENNRNIVINLHEISFRSFKIDNDFYNSNNNSINNSFDAQDISKNSMKDIRGENNTKKNKKYSQCQEVNINFQGNKNDKNRLIFSSQKELINYIKNNNIKINDNDKIDINNIELKKLKEENNNIKNEMNKLIKEKETYINEIKKLKIENELLKQKISEINNTCKDNCESNSNLKEENKNNKNNNKIKKNYNVESTININILHIQKNQNQINANKNLDICIDIKNNNNSEIENIYNIKENDEKLKDEKNDGLLSKAVFKFMNFFNEKKKDQEESN